MPLNNVLEARESALAKSLDYMEKFVNIEPYCTNKEALKSQLEDRYSVSLNKSAFSTNSSCSSEIDCMENEKANLDDYRKKRDRNNIASQKSRRKRQQKFMELKLEEQTLKKRNAELLSSVKDLERQVASFKEIMMNVVLVRK
ncbi:unnamed protein product [Gongylonema pulchrum]|uniref:BZIP domain-containing protein n=1 Tax=Gongylonema pulchrum TaxID=637853 RepID=A0A183ED43_9BILA|nr:unnamed protein product [Gongylonema pulchrum]